VQKAGGKAIFIKTDHSKPEQVKNLIQQIDKMFGRLDIAINNAGISGPMGPFENNEKYFNTEYDPMITNYYSTLYSCYEEISYWNARPFNGNYTIINVSSFLGIRGVANNAMYSASKHAINGLTQSLALEFASKTDKKPRIRIAGVAPSLIDTPMVRNLMKYAVNGTQPWVGGLVSEQEYAPFKKIVEMDIVGHRIGSPIEVANLIVFLASDEASYISGATFSIDNGLSSR